jgi:hypothetical protein
LISHGTSASEALTKGFDRSFLIAAVVMLVAIVITLFGLRSTDGRRPPAPTGPDEIPTLEPAMGD